jgi:hypothetical protein
MNIGVELVGSGPRPINFGLRLLGREASLLRRQLLPARAGSKLVCLGGTPIGLDLGDIGQVSVLARLASQLVAVVGPAPAYYIDPRDQKYEKSNDGDDNEKQHCLTPLSWRSANVMRYQGPEQRSREGAGARGRVQHGAGVQSVSSLNIHLVVKRGGVPMDHARQMSGGGSSPANPVAIAVTSRRGDEVDPDPRA